MTLEALVQVARQGLLLALLVATPILVVSWLVGVVVGTVQAATQVQDPVVGFVPRLVAVVVVLLVMAPWLGAQVSRFGASVLVLVGGVGGGGGGGV
ncbi:MAG: flagellar biosynthetic protein FliQ [Deltaproteobacteria bacterium]|nr:flagellar biosynthetic protein FliQ [Deltaproteobacteria bacterium]